jgi:hypothetical protein
MQSVIPATDAQASRDTRHDNRDEVVQIAISGGRKLESAEADFVERLVINAESLIRVFNELVDRESCVVRLDNGVGDLQSIAIQGLTPTRHKRKRTLGEGTTENVHIIRSGYSSRILEIKRVPIPEPVPPPRE